MPTLIDSGICSHCLMYVEDCECCKECRGVEVHAYWCSHRKKWPGFSAQKGRAVPPCPPTLRVPVCVINVDGADGAESTRRIALW